MSEVEEEVKKFIKFCRDLGGSIEEERFFRGTIYRCTLPDVVNVDVEYKEDDREAVIHAKGKELELTVDGVSGRVIRDKSLRRLSFELGLFAKDAGYDAQLFSVPARTIILHVKRDRWITIIA